MTIVHELKAFPSYFEAIVDGRKNFEVRYDDRGYQSGDRVLLREWDRGLVERYTGRVVTADIGYVMHRPVDRRGETFSGYVVFSLLNIKVEYRPEWQWAKPTPDEGGEG